MQFDPPQERGCVGETGFRQKAAYLELRMDSRFKPAEQLQDGNLGEADRGVGLLGGNPFHCSLGKSGEMRGERCRPSEYDWGTVGRSRTGGEHRIQQTAHHTVGFEAVDQGRLARIALDVGDAPIGQAALVSPRKSQR